MKTGDFSSGLLVQLIQASLKRQGILEEITAEPAHPQAALPPHVELPVKRQLLGKVFALKGAGPILQAGLDIEKLSENPLSYALLRADNVVDILGRFMKLQTYFHSKHRVRVVEIGENTVSLLHTSKTDANPEIYENLLIGGLITGLLSRFGCKDVSLHFGEDIAVANGQVSPDFRVPENCSSFRICWRYITPIDTSESREEIRRLATFTAAGCGPISEKIRRIVARDPVEKWKVKNIAAEIGFSTRTLQRRLQVEGTDFGKCITASRCQCAVFYMTEGIENLTAVGFLAGFSDAAHFTREFKKNMGLLPSSFQQSLTSHAS